VRTTVHCVRGIMCVCLCAMFVGQIPDVSDDTRTPHRVPACVRAENVKPL
jgi:hypothetical protein